MGMLLWIILGAAFGWAAKSWFKRGSYTTNESILLGATCGVFCGFLLEITVASVRLNSATLGSIVAAVCGAVTLIVVRRLLTQNGL